MFSLNDQRLTDILVGYDETAKTLFYLGFYLYIDCFCRPLVADLGIFRLHCLSRLIYFYLLNK